MARNEPSIASGKGDGNREKIAELAFLLKKALLAASGGRHLSRTERDELSQYLSGEEWFSKRLSRLSEEAKIARAQTMLFGRDLRRSLQRLANEGSFSKDEARQLKQWLYGIGQAKRRYYRRLVLLLVFYTGITIGLTMIWAHGLQSVNRNPLWVPFIVSIGILVAALIKDMFLDRNVDLTLQQMRLSAEKSLDDLRDVIEEALEPTIRHLDSRETVRRVASAMFADVLKEESENRIVIFTGAASLGNAKGDDISDLDDDKLSSLDEYQARLLQMQNAGVTVRRYIGLIRSPDGRRPDTIQAYRSWLDTQSKLLAENPRYILIDCFRAQPWGGSRSSILTRNAFLDMVGDGDSGFLVKGERIADALFQSTVRLLDGSAQRPYKGGEAKDLKAFDELKEKISPSTN